MFFFQHLFLLRYDFCALYVAIEIGLYHHP